MRTSISELGRVEGQTLTAMIEVFGDGETELDQAVAAELRAEQARRRGEIGGQPGELELPVEVASVQELQALDRAWLLWRWIAYIRNWPGALDFCARVEFLADALCTSRIRSVNLH